MTMKSTRTKIVCTIGPASRSKETLAKMIEAGMDVARLNFSHGSHDTHHKTIREVRRISEELGRAVAILQDLGGPKIRLGKLPVPERQLKVGEKVSLSPLEAADQSDIPVNYPYLVEDVAVVGGLRTALQYPWLFLGLLGLFFILSIWLIPKLWTAIKKLFKTLSRILGRKPAGAQDSNKRQNLLNNIRE